MHSPLPPEMLRDPLSLTVFQNLLPTTLGLSSTDGFIVLSPFSRTLGSWDKVFSLTSYVLIQEAGCGGGELLSPPFHG